ncbi:MAG TPA: demethoxyubiquinone hydroxylase family protein [Pyrinomonadaceae bacterium]|nr:demethoxyubiquinone hydroxylase family protein [Pyrinomonadaceae bacterium]
MSSHLDELIKILQLAYSGELAAAYAYRGHWRSVKDAATKARIREIEEEEWHHRRLVGRMLEQVGARPNRAREIRATVIGRTLGALCHVMGWLVPMYGAGKLESRNINEYETAARHASRSGRAEFVDCLLRMAEVEWEHERYFRAHVARHKLGARIPLWPSPAPKESIRATYHVELGAIPERPGFGEDDLALESERA